MNGKLKKNQINYASKIMNVRTNFKKLSKKEFLKKYNADYSYNPPNYPVNWFDFKKLKSLLKQEGFVGIKKSNCKKSRITEFCHDEFDNAMPQLSLFVHYKKPACKKCDRKRKVRRLDKL